MSSILVIDDEAAMCSALARLLGRHGFDVETAGSVGEATRYEFSQFDLIIADLGLPGNSGAGVIARAPSAPSTGTSVMSSARSSVFRVAGARTRWFRAERWCCDAA